MAEEEILNIPPTAGDVTTADPNLAHSESADQSAGLDDVGSDLGSDLGIATSDGRINWSARPLSASKRRTEKPSYRAAVRHGNYGVTPRRFITLTESAPKPPPPAPDLKKEAREARAARGVRRALWIIAIATALNVGVAALQWHELHRASSPERQSADTASPVNHAALP